MDRVISSPARVFFRFIRPTVVNSFRIRTWGKTRGWGSHLSNQNELTRFGRQCRQVCPFTSFSYNARPFTREVNAWPVVPSTLPVTVGQTFLSVSFRYHALVGARHVYPELRRVVPSALLSAVMPSSPSFSLPASFPSLPHRPPKPNSAASANPTASTPLAAPNSLRRSTPQFSSGASPVAKNPRSSTSL